MKNKKKSNGSQDNHIKHCSTQKIQPLKNAVKDPGLNTNSVCYLLASTNSQQHCISQYNTSCCWTLYTSY
jgi:hypothetical protein